MVKEQFINYFENPTLIKFKDDRISSVYGIRIACMLASQYRYLFVITASDNIPLGFSKKLSELHVKSIQTRTLDDYYPQITSSHTYIPKKNGIFLNTITLKEVKENDVYVYKPENLNFIVLLNNNNKHTTPSQKGSLISAIESYNTTIIF
jgi:hypothetical protein